MNVCAHCGRSIGSSADGLCPSCREEKLQRQRAKIVRERYTRMLGELLCDADTLSHSTPADKLSAEDEQEMRGTSLTRIDELVDFLGALRRTVEQGKQRTGCSRFAPGRCPLCLRIRLLEQDEIEREVLLEEIRSQASRA